MLQSTLSRHTRVFRFVGDEEDKVLQPIPESRDLGIMLYDMDFTDPRNIKPMYYHPVMVDGTIEVPSPSSDKLMR